MLAKSTLILAIAGLAGFGLAFLLLPDTTFPAAGCLGVATAATWRRPTGP